MEERKNLGSFLLFDGTVWTAEIVREDGCGWLLRNIREADFKDEISLSREAVKVHFKVLRGGLYE